MGVTEQHGLLSSENDGSLFRDYLIVRQKTHLIVECFGDFPVIFEFKSATLQPASERIFQRRASNKGAPIRIRTVYVNEGHIAQPEVSKSKLVPLRVSAARVQPLGSRWMTEIMSPTQTDICVRSPGGELSVSKSLNLDVTVVHSAWRIPRRTNMESLHQVELLAQSKVSSSGCQACTFFFKRQNETNHSFS